MRIALTGGTGIAGGFLRAEARAAGDDVTVFGRSDPGDGTAFCPYDLTGPAPDLEGFDALIHAGFAHVPGRYRGGEGDDPAGFRAANLDGTLRLWEAADRAGLSRMVFLSSRAVYGPKPPGTSLTESTPCTPDTLYGQLKLAAEQAMPPGGIALRVTGIYGAGPANKWAETLAMAEREPPAPRAGTEVHGDDLAAAVRLMLTHPAPGHCVFNVSDILLDRSDLLTRWAAITGRSVHLPPPATPQSVNKMECALLRALGWRPGGWDRLDATLRRIAG
ncbi:MAG: nucleoside-diphosphate-sugar epimerase [Rhodobacteraceae bacterium HLUCCA08]|nr:MAG: nucleoside-diphosphate-sugar epimerase [Rhodobacteraceae bacterium HLUCCA08]